MDGDIKRKKRKAENIPGLPSKKKKLKGPNMAEIIEKLLSIETRDEEMSLHDSSDDDLPSTKKKHSAGICNNSR